MRSNILIKAGKLEKFEINTILLLNNNKLQTHLHTNKNTYTKNLIMSQELTFLTPPCSPRSNFTLPGASIKVQRENYNALHACVTRIAKLTYLSIDEEAMARELQYSGYTKRNIPDTIDMIPFIFKHTIGYTVRCNICRHEMGAFSKATMCGITKCNHLGDY